jgi:hypothetical protein
MERPKASTTSSSSKLASRFPSAPPFVTETSQPAGVGEVPGVGDPEAVGEEALAAAVPAVSCGPLAEASADFFNRFLVPTASSAFFFLVPAWVAADASAEADDLFLVALGLAVGTAALLGAPIDSVGCHFGGILDWGGGLLVSEWE